MILALCLGLCLGYPFQSSYGQTCSANVVCIVTVKKNDTVEFYVDNLTTEPIVLVLDAELQNMGATVQLPLSATFEGPGQTYAFTLYPLNRRGATRYSYRYQWFDAYKRQEDCSPQYFCIITEQRGTRMRYVVDNKNPGSFTIEFNMEPVNVATSVSFPYVADFPGGQATVAFEGAVQRPFSSWSTSYRYRWVRGSMAAVHDDAYTYALPYAPGTSHAVMQGYGGQFSHTGINAIDWDMPQGTPVHAARDGVVVDVVASNTEGGVGERFRELANYVMIQHADGTLGQYVHLRPGGAVVRVGQWVARGQRIGYSGNTGYSSGPHLHFDVFKLARDLSKQTIPVRFLVGGRAVLLEEGRRY